MEVQRTKLSEVQSARKAELEIVISRGIRAFKEVGLALVEVRDSKLYKDEFDTFEDYVRTKWGMARSYAYHLIGAAKVAQNVQKFIDLPNECSARPLTKLAPKDQIKAAKVLSQNNTTITNSSVKQAVNKVTRGGLGHINAEVVIEASDVTVSVETHSFAPEVKESIHKAIDQWYARKRSVLNKYPPAMPETVVNLIKEIFR